MSSKVDGDDEILQVEILKLEEKYSGDNDHLLLRADLKHHGLGNLPLSVQTKKMLIKKLAQKMLQNDKSNLLNSFSSKEISYTKNKMIEDESSSESNSSSCSDDPNRTFYALCIPGEDDQIMIESDFLLVLKKMKEHNKKKPRMLSFSNYFEAVAFANKTLASEVCQGSLIKANYPKEKAELENNETPLFPSVSVPQLNAFRLHLEGGITEVVAELVLSNPRYLIGTGDIPTILKAGPRYNALHASVFAGKLSSCKLIMKYLCDINFLKKMYDTKERAERYSKRLVDLYLNTPEKMMNKTPLHFASEKGFAEIVAFLVSFNACDRLLHQPKELTTDDYSYLLKRSTPTPVEIACDKYYNNDKDIVKEKIINLIKESTCFVPLVRSDTTGPYAKVIDPYSPSSHHRLVQEIEENLKTATDDLKDFSNLKVWAYAGPMSPQEAHKFKREWWSPRVKKDLVQRSSLLNMTDGERGFEHYGRELAKSYNVPWQEYWPFLDSFANFNSVGGLRKLQHFFLKHSVLLQFGQLVNRKNFLNSEPLLVNEDFVWETKEDEGSFVSADSLSLASSLDLDDDECESNCDDGKANDECFFDCHDKEEERECEASIREVESSASPFRQLWNGLVQLGYYLSPRKKKQDHSQLNVSPISKDCDSNSNTLLPSKTEECYGNANKCDVDSLVKDSSGRQKLFPPDELSQEIKELNTQESYNVRKSDAVHLINKEDCACGSIGSVSNNESLVSSEISRKIDSSFTNSLTKYDYSWNGKDFNQMSTPVSYRKYRNSTPADVISPEQSDIDSGQTTPQSPGLKSNEVDTPSTPISSLDNSLDKKIDSFCRTLQAFSFLSPSEPAEQKDLEEKVEASVKYEIKLPFIKLFTNRDISSLEKLFDTCLKKQKLPVLLLKQLGEGERGVLLADIYLPIVNVDFMAVLDEQTHKAALGNAWVNFLVTFATWADATRLLSMDQPEMISVQIRRIPDGRANFSRTGMPDVPKLVETYKKNKLSLQSDQDNVLKTPLQFLAVRSSTIPLKDVYICGSVPTKTDADVYKSLNDEAVKLINIDKSFPVVAHWFERLVHTGQESIESLPSPSRVLRLSRRNQAQPPISPLVKYDTGRHVDSLITSRSRTDISVVRNIFKDSLYDRSNE